MALMRPDPTFTSILWRLTAMKYCLSVVLGLFLCGTLKRARRFVMVESVDLTQSLIKELLGLGVVG